MLVELTGARRCIEIGTFTGYSSTAVALALPEDGQIVCCDVSEEWTSLARGTGSRPGWRTRSTCASRPLPRRSSRLLSDGEQAAYDFAFVDADKTGYDGYYGGCCGSCGPAA